MLRNSILRNLTVFFLAFLGSQLTGNKTLYGAEFFCASGDVTCLIAAINEANSTPEEDIINLQAGTYTLVAGVATADGATGLPSVTSHITINGAGADVTIIERDPNLPFPPLPFAQFRIFHVSTGGTLSLNKLTVRNGDAPTTGIEPPFGTEISVGGGIANRGTLTINNSVILRNGASRGGGIWNFDGRWQSTAALSQEVPQGVRLLVVVAVSSPRAAQ